MEIFGREIELNERQEKSLTYGLVGLLILIFTYVLIVKPTLTIKENKEVYKSQVEKHERVESKLSLTRDKYNLQVEKYEEQKENYERLLIQMENASLQNNAILKEVVQKIMDESGVELESIGSLEGSDDIAGEVYEKKFIPYTVTGSGRDITKLFYYLENSEWLLTLRGSIIDLSRSGSREDEKVGARFKLGAYYPKKEVTGEESND